MKTIFTLFLGLFAISAMAQVPTNFGSDAEDGITYQNYNLIDHGAVSSVRFMAQNAITEGVAKWEFYTGNYMDNWRPYTADDTLSSFDMMIDPSIETASARYNSNFGGGTGRLPAIQAGYYYTCIIGNNAVADNFMSIIETDFNPVVIDTVYTTPTEPVEGEAVTWTVELDGATNLSPGERVFVRTSVDGYLTSMFTEITNFSGGVGTYTVPGGIIPGGTTINYYALVTEEETPVHETVDFYTLFFGNNDGNNYEVTISAITGIEDAVAEYGIIQLENAIMVNNVSEVDLVELTSVDGKMVASAPTVGRNSVRLSADGFKSGVYILNLFNESDRKAVKLFVQ